MDQVLSLFHPARENTSYTHFVSCCSQIEQQLSINQSNVMHIIVVW